MNLAACRSALLRHKIVMRFGCCLVAMSMIMSCWATPKAKAVATETALLGSIFGSLLVSMGYSWAADNMDVPGFGEALYKLTQEYDESNKDTGIQLIRDLNIAALTAGRPGTIQFNYVWVQAARSFAEWFEGKFFTDSNTTAQITGGSSPFSIVDSRGRYTVDFPNKVTLNENRVGFSYTIPVTAPFEFTAYLSNTVAKPTTEYLLTIIQVKSGKTVITCIADSSSSDAYMIKTVTITQEMVDAGCTMTITLDTLAAHNKGSVVPISSVNYVTYNANPSLTAEKPQEVHYPDVAEDGSQVYEITVDGVTATDIEGIIQGAVDQILAGTAAIAGEVAHAQDVPAEPEAPPELDGLDLPALGAALTSRFPFSIPWDIARGITLLAAPAEAPYWEVDFLAPLGYRVGGWKGSTTVVLDFSQFEVIGQVTRWMSTIGFCLMLASSTKRLIWVA